MKVLVIGSGGREHALTWKISLSKGVERIFCVPGSAGLMEIAECVDLDVGDKESLVRFAKREKIDLTVVGPEAPLVEGIVNLFEEEGLNIFGPRKEAALIEGSKSFAKKIMTKYGIPTAFAEVFRKYESAVSYVQAQKHPLVIKADGLAAGKGVTVARTREEAISALKACFLENRFGSAGKKVLIEEYLEGPEVSILAFTDGKTVIPMSPAQDYKPIYDGDEGPNTGGMGSYSPVPAVEEKVYKQSVEKILEPTIYGLAQEGLEYKGVLYGGLVLTEEGPKVLEFNVRFGDPETQALLPRLESDLAEIIWATTEKRLHYYDLLWNENPCVSVVVASQGYPLDYETGFEITGLKEASQLEQVQVFHAGTAHHEGQIVTAGGRVLNISALGATFEEARKRAYEAVDKINFEGKCYRKDIALRAVSPKSKVGM